MSVGTRIRNLGTFLEECDDGTGTVHNVEFSGRVDPNAGLTADFELTVRAESAGGYPAGLVAENVEIGDDGRLSLVLATEATVVPMDDHELDVEPTEATIGGDGTVTVSIRASEAGRDERVGAERSVEADGSAVDDPAETGDEPDGESDRDVPPFRDPDLLAEVYDSCETFAEMSDAIDMDVTAETVRRYMIDCGIHEPNRYDTGDDADTADVDSETLDTAVETPATEAEAADGENETPGGTYEAPDANGTEASGDEPETESPTAAHDGRAGREADATPIVLTDGLGLPDDLTVDALVETVSRSNTVYEVTREVGLERQETLELLERLNLIDCVVGRITYEHERAGDREVILERLRNASATRQRT